MALLTGRDIESHTQCCGVGQICRHEVRMVAPLGSPLVGAFDPFYALWVRLLSLGLIGYDYDRILVVPWHSQALTTRGWRVIPRDEETRKALALL